MAAAKATDYIGALYNHPQNAVYKAAEELHDHFMLYDNEFGDQDYVLEGEDLSKNHQMSRLPQK